VFSDSLHKLRLSRAVKRFAAGNDFLMQRAVEDMIERLSTVNLDFNDAVLLFGRTDTVASKLNDCGKIKQTKRVEESSHLGVADHVALPELLDLPAESADLVMAPMALHWSNDLPGTLIQIRRSLRPNGLMLASLPGPDTLHELRQSLLQAESDIRGGAGNRIDPFTDVRDAGSLLQRAGFSIPVVDQETLTVRYDSALDLIGDLRNFGATQHPQDNTNPQLNRDIIARTVEIYAERFTDPDGRVRATFSSVSMSGWVPHDSQQKPLRPGSAKTRLADALNVEEIKLKK